MDCGEFQMMVHAFVDGEFEERERVECEVHLAQCPSCRASVRQISLFQKTLKESYEPERAPDALRQRIQAALARKAAEQAAEQAAQAEPAAPALELAAAAPVLKLSPPPQEPAPRARRWPASWLAAAALLLAAVGYWIQAEPAQEPPAAQAIAQEEPQEEESRDAIVAESVNLHRRNLPVEVTGPSGERVRYWFHGKLDFPVRLPRFERAGHNDVNLLGARLSHLREKQAAYVVYEARGQKLSVMVFDGHHRVRPMPSPHHPLRRASPGRQIYNADGYNVAIIENNGVTYSITSELPQEDMVKLVNAAFHPKP